MQLKSVDYSKYIAIVDMRLLRRLPTSSSVDRVRGDGTVDKKKNYGDKVLDTILRRHHFAYSENTDVVVICTFAASIINSELTIKCKWNSISAKDFCSKEMPKIIIPLHVMTGWDVAPSYFWYCQQS